MMKIPHGFLRIATALIALISGGCTGSGHKPLETLAYRAEPLRNRNLIVFMRGLGSTWRCFREPHKCFETEGFVQAVRDKKLPFDMVAPNAHFGYYRDRTLDERLTEDVIRPAKAAGYEKIWLVGASMGGLGSILYLKSHPEFVDGTLLIGPYLGDTDILKEISAAGGLKSWNPGTYDGAADWQRGVWDWLKQCCIVPGARVPIYLGIGREDRYFDAQKLLADGLPKERVISVEGGHDAATFKKIWQIFLEKKILR